MKIALIGLPRSGKSTVFDLLTGSRTVPGAALDVRTGVAEIPDERLNALHDAQPAARKVPAQLEFIDLPGRSLEEARKTDVGRDVLQPGRTADAVLLVLRGFTDPFDPAAAPDPARDAQLLLQEMVLLDTLVIERRLEKVVKDMGRMKSDELPREQALLTRCREALERFEPISSLELTPAEDIRLRGFQFFTAKPLFALVNSGDEPPGALELAWGLGWVTLPARLELELQEFDPAERAGLRSELGLADQGKAPVLEACLRMSGRILFHTFGDKEVRSWTMPRGLTALDAAARIHTDLARGFIRAEVIGFAEFAELGFSESRAKDTGKMRLEGKAYVVLEGEVVTIRFHV